MFEHLNETLKEYAIKCFPKEMCGIIADDKFTPYKNVAKDPMQDFAMSKVGINKYIKSGKLQGIVHSHPVSNIQEKSAPSEQDMIGQVSSSVPWGVVDTDGTYCRDPYWWGDFQLDEDIIGKEFHPGVNDCYSLIRKFYKQRRGITISEFPRGDLWWNKGKNLYIEGFQKAGFYRISREELADGDIILGKVQSDVINHGGVILDNKEDGQGLVLHHLPNRLSRREPAASWVRKAELFLRYKDVT